jgi:hypothetical protein
LILYRCKKRTEIANASNGKYALMPEANASPKGVPISMSMPRFIMALEI